MNTAPKILQTSSEKVLLDAITNNSVLIDSEGNILVANSAWVEFAQQNDGDIQKCGAPNNYFDVCRNGDEDAQAVSNGIKSVLSGEIDIFEHYYPCHSPTENRWFIVTVKKYLIKTGEIRALVSHSDVSALIQRQKDIEARENRYRSVINSLVEGMIIQNRSGQVVSCNEAAERLLGVSEKQLIASQSILPTQKLWRQNNEPYPLLEFTSNLSVSAKSHVRDLVIGVGDNPREITWLKINSQPVFDNPDHSTADAIVTTLIAITAEENKTREITQLSERLKLAADSANLGIWDWDIKNDHLTWDDKMYQLYGIHRNDFDEVYDAWVSGIHPDDAERMDLHLKDALYTDIPFEQDFRVVWPDGSIHIIKPSAIITRDQKGVPVRMVGANQEITQKVKAEKEQQKLQNQLLQSQRLEAIGTLAGGIAHDFNNLLVPILAMTENVQQVLPPSSDESKKLDVVIRSAQRAKELVSQILTSSKQSEFKREPIFLDEVTLEALSFLRSTIPQRISIKKNIKPGHPAILGDSSQIHQIIVNLCINAVHAMSEEGQLTISVDTVLNKHKNIHSEFVCLTIQDNGCGMDENTQNRIFEPFFSTKDTQQGTGLGLPIVMGIVEQHGGRIEVESAVGRGSTFRIYFAADTGNKKCEDKKDNRVLTGKGNILLVDDQQMVCETGTLLLQNIGYQVMSFTDPLKALEFVREQQQPFDLLISDYSMPELDGVTLINKVRDVYPDIPAVLCTGDIDSQSKLTKSAINKVLSKPYGLAEISQVIDHMLKN